MDPSGNGQPTNQPTNQPSTPPPSGGTPPPSTPPPATPPAGDPSAGGQGGTPPPAGRTYTEAEVNARVQAEIDRRKAAEEAEAAKKRGEWETVAKQNEERAKQAEERARQALARASVLSAAQGANIVDPDAAYTLIQGSLKYDNDGNPTNVAELIADLAKSKPYLVGQAGQGGGVPPSTTSSGNPPGGRSGTLTLDTIRGMSEAEVRANWDAVQKVLAASGQ